MKTDEAVALLKAEMLMLAPNCNPISDLYYAVEMAIEALGDRFELNEYRQCGTVEECRSRMEWMAYSMDDIRKKFLFIREEALALAKEKTDETPSKRKRGRPRKAKRLSTSQRPFADYRCGDCQGEEGGPRQGSCEMGEA